MTKKSTSTVFAVIDLANDDQQKNIAKYAAELANALHMPLVLYPKRDGNARMFNFRRAINAARRISGTEVRIAKGKINTFNIFSSLQDIAEHEKAAFIIMGMDKKSLLYFGKTVWSTTQRMTIPTILLPRGIDFVPYQRITIAVDEEKKVQKLKIVYALAKAFGSIIKVFVENADNKDNERKFAIYRVKENTTEYLERYKIRYDIEHARKTTNFPKHLCKYSAKNADVLIVEVDPGKIPHVIKQNIQTLLSIDDYAQPVILTKTKMIGTYERFH